MQEYRLQLKRIIFELKARVSRSEFFKICNVSANIFSAGMYKNVLND